MSGLAVPTLASEVPGNFITGALWNSNVYNGLTFLLNRPIFYGYQGGATQGLTSGGTAITIDTNVVDTYGGHSTTTNNTRYVGQVPGYYKAWGVVCVGGATSQTELAAYMAKNGSELAGARSNLPANSSHTYSIPTSPVFVYLNGTTDYVELYGAADASPGTHSSSTQTSAFCVEFIHT